MGFDVPAIAKNADFLNLLTYDYHNAYEPTIQHHAPLYPQQDTDESEALNVEWTVKYYLQLGCPKEKIIVGIPMYGRSYTLANPIGSTGLGAPSEGPGEEGHATRERGYLAFYEVCQKVKDEEWEVETPYPQLMGPYAFKGNQWVGFDDEEMISLKARFILDQGLGGAMVWTLDNDDFRGICTDEQSPLVNTLRTALLYSNVIEGSSSQQLVARSAGPDASPAAIAFDNPSQGSDPSTAPVGRRNTLRRLVQNRQTARRNRHDRPTGRRVSDDQKTDNSFTTPVPPTTPDPGFSFECKDEGFFNNPKDCKKYFWCLDSGPANLGVVAHAFTCPSGLYFNAATESCDYPENVVCRTKSADKPPASAAQANRLARPRGRGTTASTTPKTTTVSLPITDDIEEYDDEEEEEAAPSPVPNKLDTRKGDEASGGENVAELLRLLQAIGGVDKLQSLLGSHGSSNGNTQGQTRPNYNPPKRTSAVDSQSVTTTRPNSEANFNRQPVGRLEPEEPSPTLQVPRRPQYVAEQVEGSRTLNNDNLFNYQEPPRKSDVEDGVGGDESEFPFQYHSPPRVTDTTSGVEYIGDDDESDIAEELLYDTPPARQTTKPAAPNVNENPVSDPGQRGNYRAPIRVQVVRIPNSAANDNASNTGVRRRMRVRVRPGGGRIIEDASQAHQGRAISRDEHKSAAAAARAVLVHDPNLAIHARNEGEARVTVRRKLSFSNNNNGTGISRVVARSRRPGDDPLRNHVPGNNGQTEGNYVAVRRVPVPTSKPPTTRQTFPARSSVIPTTREPSISVRAGYQPPLNKPTDDLVDDKTKKPDVDEAGKKPLPKVDDYDDEEYEEYEEYEDETTQPPSTTTTTTTTTTKKPLNSRSSSSRQLSPRRSRFSTSVTTAITQSSSARSTSAPRQSSQRSRTATTAKPRTTTTRPPRTTASDITDEEAVIVRSDSDVECHKRGVFIHPTECSKFIVCAPSSRSAQALRGRVLFCPANQIYLKDSGRCMKGDRNKCEKL